MICGAVTSVKSNPTWLSSHQRSQPEDSIAPVAVGEICQTASRGAGPLAVASGSACSFSATACGRSSAPDRPPATFSSSGALHAVTS